jgi:hypothetical protein
MDSWVRSKLAKAIGSGTADPSTAPARQSPVPVPSIENKPAPGQRGPAGMSGRTTYSRSNTGLPPIPDAGQTAQKNQTPRGMEFLPKLASQENDPMTTNAMARPSLQELVKTAMEASASKLEVSLEAARQIGNQGGTPPHEAEKTASSQPQVESVSTDLVHKLAAAAHYSAQSLVKESDANFPTHTSTGPGEGPNALGVMAATEEGDGVMEAGQSGKATAPNQPPITPNTQKDQTRQADPGNGLATNDDMMHDEQPEEPISNEKAPMQTPEQAKMSSAYVNNLIAVGLLKTAATENGLELIPANEVVKEALLVSPAGAAWGASQAPKGRKLEGAARGSTGTAAGGTAGALGGAALGGVGGAGLGAGLGALAGHTTGFGAGTGAMLGAGAGGLLGAGAGAAGGNLYGRQKGYNMAMKGVQQPKQASVKTAAARMAALVKQAEEGEEAVNLTPDQEKRLGIAGGGILGGAIGAGAGALGAKRLGMNPLSAVTAGALGGGAIGGTTAAGIQGAREGAELGRSDPDSSAVEGALSGAARGIGGGAVGGTVGTGIGAAGGGALGGALGAGAGGALGAGVGGVAGAAKHRSLKGALEGAGMGGALGAGMGALGGGLYGAASGGVTGGIEGTQQGREMAMAGQRELADRNQRLEAQMAAEEAEAAKEGSAERLRKVAYAKNLMAVGLYKLAEDAINPAQISAPKRDDNGTNSPALASSSEENPPAEPSDVNSQKSLISSNEAAINFTKRDAKGDPKSDVGDVLQEPAQTSATDKVLDKALDHTDAAGAKISSADLTRIAGARAVLNKLAMAHDPKSKKNKKTKKAMGAEPAPLGPAGTGEAATQTQM